MKNKISQKQIILKELRKNGTVSRNACIRGDYGTVITRLSEIIHQLRKAGMSIEMKETTKPIETTYTLLDKPTITPYYVNGVKVSEKITW